MLGVILGDIIGSPYEYDINNIKTNKSILSYSGRASNKNYIYVG